MSLRERIAEILDDEYGESAPCIVNLILAAVVAAVEGMPEIDMSKVVEAAKLSPFALPSHYWMAVAQAERAAIVALLKEGLDI